MNRRLRHLLFPLRRRLNPRLLAGTIRLEMLRENLVAITRLPREYIFKLPNDDELIAMYSRVMVAYRRKHVVTQVCDDVELWLNQRDQAALLVSAPLDS